MLPQKSRQGLSPTDNRLTTESTSPGRARREVFEESALVEKILLRLPAKSIFAFQSVCRRLRDIVASSTVLQEYLWRRRLHQELLTLVMKEPKLDISEAVLSFSVVERPNTVVYTPVRLNSLLSIVNPRNCIKSRKRMQLSKDNLVKFSVPRQIRGPQAWHHAPLSSPPIKAASLLLFWQVCRGVHGYSKRSVRNENGLNFGDAIGAALFRKDKDLGDYDWYVEDTHHKVKKASWRVRRYKPCVSYERKLVDILDDLEEKYRCVARLTGGSYLTAEEMGSLNGEREGR